MKVIIYAKQNQPNSDVVKQLEVCQNFADFYDYEVVGVATEIDTLFTTSIEYDGVLVTQRSRISRSSYHYEEIKQDLLKMGVIIIEAVRTE